MNPQMPTSDQIKGMADRIVAMLAVWLVAKGYVGKDFAVEFGPVIVALVSVWYGWWINRPKAILQSAAAVPGTTVVTVPEFAHSTPETNIVSAVTNSVVSTASLNQAEAARHS